MSAQCNKAIDPLDYQKYIQNDSLKSIAIGELLKFRGDTTPNRLFRNTKRTVILSAQSFDSYYHPPYPSNQLVALFLISCIAQDSIVVSGEIELCIKFENQVVSTNNLVLYPLYPAPMNEECYAYREEYHDEIDFLFDLMDKWYKDGDFHGNPLQNSRYSWKNE